MAEFLAGVGAGLLLVFAIGAALVNRGPLDDTDNTVTGERSNMRIRVDYRTGCQYLTTGGGGITPRVDGRGRHIGCAE